MQVALRTQQIVAYESGVADTVDPLAGSYYIENLTNEIESKAKGYIEQIDKMGGSPAAIENGFIQREIQNSAYEYQMAVEKSDRIVVGINKFRVKEDQPTKILRVDPSVREQQVGKINKVKAERSAAEVQSTLAALKQAAQGDENLMVPIVNAVRVYATLGEICDVLREVFGEYKPSTFF